MMTMNIAPATKKRKTEPAADTEVLIQEEGAEEEEEEEDEEEDGAPIPGLEKEENGNGAAAEEEEEEEEQVETKGTVGIAELKAQARDVAAKQPEVEEVENE